MSLPTIRSRVPLIALAVLVCCVAALPALCQDPGQDTNPPVIEVTEGGVALADEENG